MLLIYPNKLATDLMFALRAIVRPHPVQRFGGKCAQRDLGVRREIDVQISTHDDELAGYEALDLGVHGGQLRPCVDILLLMEIGQRKEGEG